MFRPAWTSGGTTTAITAPIAKSPKRMASVAATTLGRNVSRIPTIG